MQRNNTYDIAGDSIFFEKYNFEYRSKYFGYLFVPLLPIKMVHYSHGRETIE